MAVPGWFLMGRGRDMTMPGRPIGTVNDGGSGGLMSPEMRARALAYFQQQPMGASTQAPGPTTGGYNTAPPASPTTYAPPTGQYIPPGGGSPFPFNFPQAATPPTPGGYWRPAEFERPATPYPTSPLASRSSTTSSPTNGGKSRTASSVVAAPNITPFSYSPPALGGGYFPGHGANSANIARNLAAAHARKSMSVQDLRNARRVAAGGATYGNPGSSNTGATQPSGTGSYQDAYNEARAENEARYRDILTGFQDRYERNMRDLQGSGQMEQQDINELYDAQAAAMRQSLVGRGLGNSTVVDTMMMGNNEQRANSQGRLQERLRQQRIGLDSDLSGDVLSFMERREDEYPDINLMAQLAEALGRAGYGQQGGVSEQGGTSGVRYQPQITGVDYVSPSALGFNIPMGAWGPTMGVPIGGGGGSRRGGSSYDYQTAKDIYRARNAAKNAKFIPELPPWLSVPMV